MVGAVVATSYVMVHPHPVLAQGIALLTPRLSPEEPKLATGICSTDVFVDTIAA